MLYLPVLLSIPFNKLPCTKDIQSPVGGLKMSGWPNSRPMKLEWIILTILIPLLNKGNWCSRYVYGIFVISIYFEKDGKFIYFIKMELLFFEQFRMSFRVCKEGIRLNDLLFWGVLFDPHPLKYGFCNKSFRKDEPLTSWTLLQHICPHFWEW